MGRGSSGCTQAWRQRERRTWRASQGSGNGRALHRDPRFQRGLSVLVRKWEISAVPVGTRQNNEAAAGARRGGCMTDGDLGAFTRGKRRLLTALTGLTLLQSALI